jgi:diguanylate cyclase (GGDEF)-like protein/PAS domain S-box-containing protein
VDGPDVSDVADDDGGVGTAPDDPLDALLTSLAENHKETAVFAMAANALLVPVPESLDLHGHRVAAFPIGHSSLDLVIPAYKASAIGAWERVRHGTHSQTVIKMVEDPDRAVLLDLFDARQSHGAYIGVIATAESDEGAPRLATELPDLTPRFARVRKDELAILLETDDSFTKILGWAAEEVVGKRTLDLVHPEDQELALANWVDLLADVGPGRRVRLRHLHRDGSWVWMEVTNHNLLQDPDYGCVVAEMIDISEEMATLWAREQLLDRLAESVPVGLLQVDTDSQVVYTNDRFHFMIGAERTDEIEQQLAAVIEEDRYLVEEAFDTVLHNGIDTYVEVRVRTPDERDKELRYCSLNLRALTDEEGTVTGAIVCVDDVTESVNAREELRARATFDTVTNCYNRSSTISALEDMLAGDDRRGRPAAIFVDLDRFKDINDAFGHPAGDEFLKVVAERLQRSVRGEDVVGRIGGDEFLVLCAGISSPFEAMRTASRLARALTNPVQLKGFSAPSKASIGVAWSDAPGMTVEKMVARADAAMYESKRDGTGEPVLFEESLQVHPDDLEASSESAS